MSDPTPLLPMDDARWTRMTWAARQQWLRASIAHMRHTRARAIEAENELARLNALRAELEQHVIVRHIWADDDLWTDVELKAAHSAHVRGERDEWSTAGERIYQRNRRRPKTCECGASMSDRSKRCMSCANKARVKNAARNAELTGHNVKRAS